MLKIFSVTIFFCMLSISQAGVNKEDFKKDIFNNTDFLVRQPQGDYIFQRDATLKNIFCSKGTLLTDNHEKHNFMLRHESGKNTFCRFKEFTINNLATFNYDGSPVYLSFDEREKSLNPYGRNIGVSVWFGQEKAIDKIISPFNPQDIPYLALSDLREGDEIGEEGLIIFFKKAIRLKDILSLPPFSKVTFGMFFSQTYISVIDAPRDSFVDLAGLPCETIAFRRLKGNLNVPNICRLYKSVKFNGLDIVKGDTVYFKNSVYLKNKAIEAYSLFESATGNTYRIQSGKKVKTTDLREELMPN